jgi:hypothetical protein
MRWTTVLLITAVWFTIPASAEDAAAKKPSGTWARKADDKTITFDFKANDLRVTISCDSFTIVVDADYGFTKDGTLFGIVTKTKKTGTDSGPAEGDLFSFRVKAEKDKVTLSDLKGTAAGGDDAKNLVEGEYKPARDQ